MSKLKEIFTNIYNKDVWQGRESKSGKGSDIENTKDFIPELVKLIKKLEVKTLLDCASGDFNWMKEVMKELPEISYLGYDIVTPLIEKNNELYASNKILFQIADITENILPKHDLVFCRDCLVHLSFKSINKFFKNFVDGGSKYLLVTSFTGDRENKDYDEYERMWRTLSFHKEPFEYLPFPLEVINENCKEGNMKFSDKSLLLYSRESLIECGI